MTLTVIHTIDPAIINLLQTFIGNVGGQAAPSRVNGKAVKELTASGEKEKLAPAPVVEATDTATPAAKEVSLSEVRALVQGKSTEGKKDSIKAVLADFGVPNVSALKADQYSSFYAKIEAL